MHIFYLFASFISPGLLSKTPQHVADNNWKEQQHQSAIHRHQNSGLMKLNYSLKDHLQDNKDSVPTQELENCENCYKQTMATMREHMRSHPNYYIYVKEAVDILTTNYYQGYHNADSISKVFKSALVVQKATAMLSQPVLYDNLLSQFEYSQTFGFRKSVSSYHAFAYLVDTLYTDMVVSNPNQKYDQDLILMYKTWKDIDALVENDIKEECPMVRTASKRAKQFLEKYVNLQDDFIAFQ